MEKKEKSRYESRYETKAHNKIEIDESESILNTNNTQQNLSNLKKNLKPRTEKIKNDRINLNKGICSNSTKNINSKAKKYNISNNNYNSNNNIKINNRKNSNMYKKKIQNKEVISPQASVKFPKQNNSLDIPQLKRNKILSNQLNSKKDQEKILLQNKNEEKNANKTNEKKPEIKSTKEESKHQKEKKSSISNYIFKEDYRIKDDIESNSNLNNLEDTEKNGKKKITSQDFSQSEFKIEKNEDLIKQEDLIKKEDLEKKENLENNMTNKVENTDTNEPKNLEQKKENVNEKKDKKKFIFKIRIKDNLIKLVINKGDDIKAKINAFCKENDLDEDDKEEILKAINTNLNA